MENNKSTSLKMIKNSTWIQKTNQHPKGICLSAIKNDPSLFKHIKNKTKEMCFIAVEKDGYLLEHVPNHLKCEKMCLVAIKQNPYALKFVDEQTNEIYLEVLNRNPQALFSNYEFPKKIKKHNVSFFKTMMHDVYNHFIIKKIQSMCKVFSKKK